ncbi:MAG: DUF5662 family protein [Lachnospiraceae bacterium]|nr:DUF5662 family protein [Lachnospiraceae bacterium]
MKAIKHLRTINAHRRLVRKGCFKVGLYYQGLTHDLSKYSLSEFPVGAKYYQGFRSPNNAEREAIGYSSAWLHHKGRNRHHYEYWFDYSSEAGGGIIPARMPDKYIIEMFMDRIAASKIYNGDKYTDDMPLKYYHKGKPEVFIEKDTRALLEKLLHMLADEGEEACFEYIRKKILWKRPGTRIAQYIEDRRKSRSK